MQAKSLNMSRILFAGFILLAIQGCNPVLKQLQSFSEENQSATIGNERGTFEEEYSADNYSEDKHLDNDDDRLATVGVGENEMGRGGLEPPTQGFSVPCSTT